MTPSHQWSTYTSFIRFGAALGLTLALFFLPHTVAHAQFALGTSAATISLTPSFPPPGSSFEARVEAYSFNLSQSSIRWYADGVAQPSFSDAQVATFTAPALGDSLALRAVVTDPSGVTHTAEYAVTPSAIDLIVESDTRVPHFYRGRALPSAGSTVRVIAQPTAYTRNGVLASPESLVYTWRVDKRVAKAGRGASVLETSMPQSGSLLVDVTVESTDGSVYYAIAERIEVVQPENLFYEDNPLHGLSRIALPAQFTLLADEISVRAEPYHVSRNILSNASTEWRIDNLPVANPNTDPQTLTLRTSGGMGYSNVSFSIRNLSSLTQAARGAFIMYFQ